MATKGADEVAGSAPARRKMNGSIEPEIEISKRRNKAAEALKPLAGSLAYTLYTLGLIGIGLLAIPTLTGSAAYAVAETFK